MSSESSSISSNKEWEVVEKFVKLLGSSGLIVGEDEKQFSQCISPTVDDDDIICSLPAFKVKEENKDGKPIKIIKSLGKSVLGSMLRLERPDNDDSSVFTKETIGLAPLTLLHDFQEVFKFYSKSRFLEWKHLLEEHPSQEAAKLVQLMKYHKMIAGCRGNTSFHIVGPWEQCTQKDEDESLDTCSISSESTEEERSVLECRLRVEFFVKIRNGPRTFTTSSYTLSFDVPGVIWCKLNSERIFEFILSNKQSSHCFLLSFCRLHSPKRFKVDISFL
jgi:hypothetical protein